jgi:hypothetical protein
MTMHSNCQAHCDKDCLSDEALTAQLEAIHPMANIWYKEKSDADLKPQPPIIATT